MYILEQRNWLHFKWDEIALRPTLDFVRLLQSRVLMKATCRQRHATTVLHKRQIKVLNRLLDTVGEEFEGGTNARKYQSLAKVSKATATRDLAELLDKDCLTSYPAAGAALTTIISKALRKAA